jgi:hypothetical protein
VVASRWLHEAPKRVQLLLFASPLLLLPNVLALGIILASWAVVILIWAGITATAIAILGLFLTPWVRWHIPVPRGLGWAKELAQWHWCLAFALCTSVAGSILWLCSSNLHGLILFLVVPGFVYPLSLLSENTRKYQAVGTLLCLYIALGITGLTFTVYDIYA